MLRGVKAGAYNCRYLNSTAAVRLHLPREAVVNILLLRMSTLALIALISAQARPGLPSPVWRYAGCELAVDLVFAGPELLAGLDPRAACDHGGRGLDGEPRAPGTAQAFHGSRPECPSRESAPSSKHRNPAQAVFPLPLLDDPRGSDRPSVEAVKKGCLS